MTGTSIQILAAWLAIMPFKLYIRIGHTPESRVVRFQFCSELLGMIPFHVGVFLRQQFYRSVLNHCGSHFVARHGVTFVYPNAVLGDRVFIGHDSSIGLATLGDDVLISHRVSLLSGRHHHDINGDINAPISSGLVRVERIHIGAGAWIGADATVLCDVGEGAVVGAGSVVVRPVPPHTIVAGNPARVIKVRSAENHPETFQLDRSHCHACDTSVGGGNDSQ